MTSLEEIKTLFDCLPVPSIILKTDAPDFTIAAVNKAFIEVTYSRTRELTGMPFFEAFPMNADDDGSRTDTIKYAFNYALRHKKLYQIGKHRYDMPSDNNGGQQTRYWKIDTYPLFDTGGQMTYIVQSSTDITSLHIAEEEASRNEEKANRILESITDGFFSTDAQDRVIYWNTAAERISGLKRAQVEGRSLWDLYPDAELSGFKKQYRKVRETRQAVSFEQAFDNPSAQVEITLYPSGDGVSAYFRNITYRKKAEAREKLMQQRNSDLFNFSPMPMWVYDLQTLRIRAANKAACRDYGYSAEEFLSLTVAVLWPEEDRDRMLRKVNDLAAKGLPSIAQVRHITRDGRILHVDITSEPLPTWDENARIIVALDVTDKLRATQAEKLFNDLNQLERNVLELHSKSGTATPEVLAAYLSGLETLFPQMTCSIMRVRNRRVYNWASPSLPAVLMDGIEGTEVGPDAGSCGTAAYLKEKVIVKDIKNDERWERFRDITLQAGFGACWSHPVIDSSGEVIATFAVYYRKPAVPDGQEQRIIERVVALLAIILENRQYEEMITENSVLMAQGQELAQFGNWSWEIADNVVSWSDTLYHIYGIDKKEFKATFEGYQELLHPDDRQRVFEIISGVLQTKEDVEFEERIVRKNGEIRYLRSWGTLKCDEAGVPVKMVGACLDITDSKKTQEELQASEARLRSLVDAQTNYVMRMDVAGRYTYYNKKYRQDFGWLYDHADFTGADTRRSVVPAHQDRAIAAAQKCLDAPGEVIELELDKPAEDGSVKTSYWHLVALTDESGTVTEIQCIGIDVSEWKRAERELRKSNERYEYLSKASNDAIYDWDTTEDHITWGDGFSRVFGYPVCEDKFPLKSWATLIHADDLDAISTSLQHALNDPEKASWTAQYRFRRADGSYAFVEEIGYIVRNEAKAPVRMIGSLQDVTERVKYVQEIEAHNARLKDIAWTQSHLVRGPLARILGLVELLHYPQTEQDKAGLEKILDYLHRSATELDQVITDIIDKSQHYGGTAS